MAAPRGTRVPRRAPIVVAPKPIYRDAEALRAVRPAGSTTRKISVEQLATMQQVIADYLVGTPDQNGWLRPYQIAWLQDHAQQKVANISRQMGKSEMIALEANLQGLEPPETPEKCEIIVSASQAQADEVMMKARRWANWLNEISVKLLGTSIFMNGKPPNNERIWFYNGVRIVTLPANPYSAAGYHGDVFWDEVAKTPHDDLMWDALHPMISSQGFRFRATSTPWGDTGKFYDMWHDLPDWSRHQTTILDAVRQGVPRDIRRLRAQYDANTWAQNYLCRFLGSLTSAYPRELIRSAMELFIQWDTEYPLPKSPSPGVWPDDVYVTLGVDIGRTNDRTSFVWCYEYPQGMFRFERVRNLPPTPFAQQENMLREILRAGEINKCEIDATGIGMQMSEELHDEFPEIVTPVTFTNAQKAQMVLAMRASLERGELAMCPDNDLISDFTAVKQEIMESSRTVKYGSERTATGHADSHWAAGLAFDAQVNRDEWNIGDEHMAAQSPQRRQLGKGFSVETPLPQDPYYGGMAGVPTGSDVTGFSGFDGDVEDLAEMDEETREMALLGFDVGLDDDDDRPSRRKRERTPDGHLGRRAGLASPFNKKS